MPSCCLLCPLNSLSSVPSNPQACSAGPLVEKGSSSNNQTCSSITMLVNSQVCSAEPLDKAVPFLNYPGVEVRLCISSSPLSDLAGLRTLVSREPQGLAFVRAGSDRFRMACFVIQKPVTKRQKLMRGPHNGALKGRIRPLQGRIRTLQGLIRLRPVREPFEAM